MNGKSLMSPTFLCSVVVIVPSSFLNEIPVTVFKSFPKRTASTASYAEISPSPVITISPFVLFKNKSGIAPATELPTITHESG